MRKADIGCCIAEATDLTQMQEQAGIAAVFEEIKSALQQGDSVILRRFGSFEVRDKRARIGRHPKTSHEVDIAARRVVRLRSGKQF